jgi:1,4-dihydroxy-2-naphthoyl-CoA hydrolase
MPLECGARRGPRSAGTAIDDNPRRMDIPDDASEYLNQHLDGWCAAMGMRFVHAGRDEVVAELTVGPRHLQAYGIVHGGVHSGLVETLASVGAALNGLERGQTVVGLENHTSFLRAVRGGVLRGTARPLTRGRRSQVWEANVHDAEGGLVATGRVRVLCLDAGAEVAGETVVVKAAVPVE